MKTEKEAHFVGL